MEGETGAPNIQISAFGLDLSEDTKGIDDTIKIFNMDPKVPQLLIRDHLVLCARCIGF